MSVKALTWSFNLRLPDMAAKAVLHALADHADEQGRCWPSIKRIAQWAGCNEKTARKALQRVEMIGAIRREERAGMSDVFTLVFDWTPPECGTSQNRDHSQIREVPDPTLPLPDQAPHPSLKRPDTPPRTGTRTTKEPSKNRHSNRQAEPDDEQPRKLPGDWQPSPDSRAHAIDKGLDPASTAEAFADYFTQGRGKREKRTTTGWERRFRIWCTTDAERRAPARAAGTLGNRANRPFQPPRGNDAFFEQLADIASRDD